MHHEVPAQPLISLSGEVVLVTGAGSGATSGPHEGRESAPKDLWGIGAAIAAYAALAGASVGVLDVDLTSAQRTVERLATVDPTASARMIALGADVTDETQVVAAVERLRRERGPLSGLVNNVGIGGPGGTAAAVDLDGWSAAFEINVTSMVVTTRIALPDLERTHGGIVNISSLAGIRGGHHGLSYPTTKAAVIGMSQTMAGHHGPAGVRVNTVAPGLLHTPMVANRGLSDERRRTRAAASMLGVEGSSWDVAGPVAFLLSRAASWITGVTLPVDAGLSAIAPNLGVVARDA